MKHSAHSSFYFTLVLITTPLFDGLIVLLLTNPSELLQILHIGLVLEEPPSLVTKQLLQIAPWHLQR